MAPDTFSSTLYRRVCCFVLFFVASAASFSGFYQKWHFREYFGADSRYHFERQVDGTAFRPFVYRRLVPDLANWLDRITPQATKNWLYVHQLNNSTLNIQAIASSRIANDQQYYFRYVIVYVVTFAFTLIAVYMMYLVCKACGAPSPAAVFAPVILILLFPYFMTGGGFYYDISELAIFALAVWMALEFDWWWLIPVAALGAWNKESFLLMIPTLYPLLRKRHSRRSAVSGVIALSVVCLLVYSLERARFAHNPGSALESHWLEQISLLVHPRTLLAVTEETYGVRMLAAYTLLPLILIIWTVVRAWKHLPRAIQRHGQIALAINIPLYLLFCAAGELRDLSMLYILLLLSLAANLSSWMQIQQIASPCAEQPLPTSV